MRVVAIKISDDSLEKHEDCCHEGNKALRKTNENYCHGDFIWHNLQSA
jgi:hypothetical protein